jgi:hypothetical protein
MKLKRLRHQRLFYRSLLTCLISATLSFFTPFQVVADTESDLINERIDKLEKELAELKTLLKETKAEGQEVAATAEVDNKKVEAATSGETNRFKFSPYGYIKLDASYDDSAVINGDYVIYVPSEATVKNDNEFNMTARQTRLGMAIAAPDFQDWQIKGRVEIDFYGDGPVLHENKSEMMMRHAFLEFRKGSFRILAGQTWDVISPLNPYTLNYTAGWAAGNIGYRRPQIRFSYNTGKDDPMTISTELAFTRTSGLINENLDSGSKNDGEDSGIPTIQGRIALTTELFGRSKSVFGISGHYGEEEVDWAGSETDMKSWSVNLDFIIPLYDYFTLTGEAFIGENLDDYFGGVLQGINAVTQSEIRSKGVWAQIGFKPGNKWQYNTGFGLDDPDNKDINDYMRDKNSFYFINALFNLTPFLTLGLEYSYWTTNYLNLGAARDNRLQFSFIYSWK